METVPTAGTPLGQPLRRPNWAPGPPCQGAEPGRRTGSSLQPLGFLSQKLGFLGPRVRRGGPVDGLARAMGGGGGGQPGEEGGRMARHSHCIASAPPAWASEEVNWAPSWLAGGSLPPVPLHALSGHGLLPVSCPAPLPFPVRSGPGPILHLLSVRRARPGVIGFPQQCPPAAHPERVCVCDREAEPAALSAPTWIASGGKLRCPSPSRGRPEESAGSWGRFSSSRPPRV